MNINIIEGRKIAGCVFVTFCASCVSAKLCVIQIREYTFTLINIVKIFIKLPKNKYFIPIKKYKTTKNVL
jgi:hypothetical protein